MLNNPISSAKCVHNRKLSLSIIKLSRRAKKDATFLFSLDLFPRVLLLLVCLAISFVYIPRFILFDKSPPAFSAILSRALLESQENESSSWEKFLKRNRSSMLRAFIFCSLPNKGSSSDGSWGKWLRKFFIRSASWVQLIKLHRVTNEGRSRINSGGQKCRAWFRTKERRGSRGFEFSVKDWSRR